MHSAMMLRVDECSLISSPGEFDDIRVADMAGDWWSAQIKAKDRKFYRGVRLGGLRRYGEWPRLLICTEI